jgi:hypothetical protein
MAKFNPTPLGNHSKYFLCSRLQDNSKTQCTICLKFITIKSLSKHMAAFHKDLLKSSSSSSSSSSILTTNDNNNILINNSRTTTSSSASSSSSFAATSSSKSGKGGGGKAAAALEEKTHPCRYCKKAFVSAAKLRLHVAKCHAEERHKSESLNNMAALSHLEENIQRHYFTAAVETQQADFQLRVLHRPDEPRFPSPSGDSLPSQQVPELGDLVPYNAHSSPEDHHGGGGSGPDLNSSALSTSSSSSGGSSSSMTAAKDQLLQVARRLTQEDDDDDNDLNGGLGGGGFSIPTIHIPEFPDAGPVIGGVRTGGLCAAEISNEAIHALFFN